MIDCPVEHAPGRHGHKPLTRAVSFLGLFLFVLINSIALGQGQLERVEEVRILGNRRIPESTILYYIQTKANDPYNESQILRDYRSILNTNFFKDAKVLVDEGLTGKIVIFEVQEKPIIRRLVYEGMKSFKESDVLEKFRDMRVGITVDSPFDEAKLPRARRAMSALLEEKGRPLGRVEVEAEAITTATVALKFIIDEGPKVRIGDISFEGNTVFSDDELKGFLELNKERGPIVMFKSLDKYIPDKLEYDVQLNLLSKYKEKGYIFAKAGAPDVRIMEAPQGMLIGFRKTKQQYFITIPIEEGEQFSIGEFSIAGAEQFNEEFIRNVYKLDTGDVANYTILKESTDSLKDFYSDLGYLDMDARPDIRPNMATRTVDVNISITEGTRYVVNRIDFAGNTKTRDKVMRREFLLEEQQEFNGRLLDFSIIRLNQLGFFETIEEEDYEVLKRPDEGEVDVMVNVSERSIQSIGFNGGYSGYYGAFIGVNYQTNNFRGRGERIDVNLQGGSRSANYTFGFTQPYFLDTRASMGFTLFDTRMRYDTFSAYYGMISLDNNVELFTRRNTGFNFSTSYPLARWVRAGLRYSFTRIKVYDVDPTYENYATNQLVGFTPGGDDKDAEDGLNKSEIAATLTYNTKNAYYNANRGTQLSLMLPVSGGFLGGAYNLITPYVDLQHFRSDMWFSGGRNTWAFRWKGTHIIPFGTTVSGAPMAPPFYDRYFVGGEWDLRGFYLRSVSPWAMVSSPVLDLGGNPLIDPNIGLPLLQQQLIVVGGDTYTVGTMEYRVPIVGPLQLNLFADIGSSMVLREQDLVVFGPDTYIDLVESTNNVLRMSTGAEVQFQLPVLNQPFRLIFAYNPLKLDTEVMVDGVSYPLREPNTDFKFTVGYSF